MTARVGEEDVAVVGRREIDELLPFVFVVEDGNEMALLFGGYVFAHAAENHRSDEWRRTLEDGELVVSAASVWVEIGGEPLVPGCADLAAFVRETEDED
jgi:hypothetical protein